MHILTSKRPDDNNSNHISGGDGYYGSGVRPGVPVRAVQPYLGAAHHEAAQDLPEVQKSLLEYAEGATLRLRLVVGQFERSVGMTGGLTIVYSGRHRPLLPAPFEW